jgi:hypothetical protein
MKSKLNIRRGRWNWTRFNDLASPSCDGWSLANGWFNRDNERQFQFEFGAYRWTKVRVYADSWDSAFEIAVEWLDDNAPGHLTTLTDDDLKESAEELGLSWPLDDTESEDYWKVVENAEQDLTAIGHTTLKHGTHVDSEGYDGFEITR